MRVLLASLLLCFAACTAAAVTVVDDDGRRITLAQPARRIVSIAPHLTELLFAAGAGDRVVGVSAWSDYPPAARRLPQVGDAAMLDLERIVALKPDLVVVWRDGSAAQQLERLAASGLTVYASQALSLEHIAATLRQFGVLAGTSAVAEARAAAFEHKLADLRARFSHRRPLKVFYQIWNEPLLTINGHHVLTEALQICGAVNAFADLPALVPTVTAEAVLAADPDVIVTGRVDPGAPDQLDAWRRLKTLRAARNGHLLVVNPDTLHRSTDRMADGIEALCLALDRLR